MAVDGLGLLILGLTMGIAALTGAAMGAALALRPIRRERHDAEPAPVIRADWQHDAMDARAEARLRLYREGP